MSAAAAAAAAAEAAAALGLPIYTAQRQGGTRCSENCR